MLIEGHQNKECEHIDQKVKSKNTAIVRWRERRGILRGVDKAQQHR